MTSNFFRGVKVPKAVVSGEAREIKYHASVFDHLQMPQSMRTEKKEKRELKKLTRMDQQIHEEFGQAAAGVDVRPLSRVLIQHDNARTWLLADHNFSVVSSILREDNFVVAADVVRTIASKFAAVAA
jgi:hypothetical protein